MGQVVTGHVGLDLDQIVQSHLQRAITGPGPTERLLDEGAKGQNTFAACGCITSERYCGQGPDGLDDLRRGVFIINLQLWDHPR